MFLNYDVWIIIEKNGKIRWLSAESGICDYTRKLNVCSWNLRTLYYKDIVRKTSFEMQTDQT